MKIAISSLKIQQDKELKKNPDRLKRLKTILCEDPKFWESVALIEEILRPLKTSILKIQYSVVDVQQSYKLVESAFKEANEIARRFPDHLLQDEIKEVPFKIMELEFLFRFLTLVSIFARAI